MHVADHAAIEGKPGKDRQVALGDAEGLVDLQRVAPFRDDLPALQDEPVRPAARPNRTQYFVPRRVFIELPRNLGREVAAPRCLAFRGMARRRGKSVDGASCQAAGAAGGT
jgi:hypothetical protein